MTPEEEPTIEHNDTVPSFIEQARLMGWRAGIFSFGKAEGLGNEYFNPGLVRRPDGLWLLVRCSELIEGYLYGKNKIWACRLSDSGRVPEGGPVLQFPDSGEEEQFEDPRAVQLGDQTFVGCVNFTWYPDGSWTGAHQTLGIFKMDSQNSGPNGEDGRWPALARRDPPVESNLDRAGHTEGRHNKNWLWFFWEGNLMLIYYSDPWHVIRFGDNWHKQTPYKGEGVKWKYGAVRGGTPPVLVDGLYYTFFHSSLPWKGRYRRYYMGALAFESQPPFAPVKWTREPLLQGSQNDPWAQRKPLVVFPCGAVLENDRWFISMGINDLKSGWVDIPHEDVLRAIEDAPKSPLLGLMAAKTERPDFARVEYHGPYDMGPAQPVKQPGPDEPTGDRVYKPELIEKPHGVTVQEITRDPFATEARPTIIERRRDEHEFFEEPRPHQTLRGDDGPRRQTGTSAPPVADDGPSATQPPAETPEQRRERFREMARKGAALRAERKAAGLPPTKPKKKRRKK